MRTGAIGFGARRYRVLGCMILLFTAISLAQILSEGTSKIFTTRIGRPFRWIISYTDPSGKSVTKEVASPNTDLFSEGKAKGTIRVEMDFRKCQPFGEYRFWVGPYGTDSTDRQPSQWTLFARGDRGDWQRGHSAQVKDPYQNDRWYEFAVHDAPTCIQHLRWEITKVWRGDTFRLYRFQLYNPFSAVIKGLMPRL